MVSQSAKCLHFERFPEYGQTPLLIIPTLHACQTRKHLILIDILFGRWLAIFFGEERKK